MAQKHKFRYQFRLFITAVLCIWAAILSFAWFVYHLEKELRAESIIERIDLANGYVVDVHETNGDVQSALNFIHRYLADTYLNDMSIQIFDTRTQQLLYATGDLREGIPSDISEDDRVVLGDSSRVIRVLNTSVGDNGRKMFFFSSRLSPDGRINIRTYVPPSRAITEELTIGPMFWVILIGIGLLGSVLAFITTSHQAKNVSLLNDFAKRAASDRDFIPMGDFPSDEIGEISRQIVAIYNSRMQANMRREHEHEIALKVTEEKNKMKHVLTDNISHELKTPIGIIRAYVEMMLTEEDMPAADRKRFLEKTQANVERLVAMLNDLSTMTRLEESGGKIPIKEVDFSLLVYSIADEMEQSGILNGFNLKTDLPPDIMVLGNEGLLTSVLQNLTKNSIAYSQGTEIGISLLDKTEGYYTFSFYDNGVGVGKEHIPHLFDRFYRVDTGRSRKVGGAGLGLPIVKSSINNMGGSVSVRNRRGGGLEFIFTLCRPK